MEAGGSEGTQNEEQSHPKKCSGSRTLVVGHYCHDLIKLSSGNQVQALGGSVSYITNVLDALGLQCRVVSKVGSDFSYASAISHSPSVIEGARTTQFFADFTGDSDRVLRVPVACEPILPSDIPSHHPTDYAIGLAVGVAREILPETLRRMVEVSNLVVVDAQALIRTIHPVDGTVGLRSLAETDFYELLDQISFLKASSLESPYVDIEAARQKTCVLVTEGDNGCRVFERDREFHVPAFPAEEVDPTGAGDSFLAGFSAGLIMGLSVEDAVQAGNFFGSVTVGQIGVPQFTKEHLQGRITVSNLASASINPAQAADQAQRKLYIGGLSYETPNEKIINIFSQFGEIEEGSVAYDKNTNKSRGFAFVTFKTVEAAKRALEEPNKNIDGRVVNVKLAVEGQKERAASQPGASPQVHVAPHMQTGYAAVNPNMTSYPRPQVPASAPPTIGFSAYPPGLAAYASQPPYATQTTYSGIAGASQYGAVAPTVQYNQAKYAQYAAFQTPQLAQPGVHTTGTPASGVPRTYRGST